MDQRNKRALIALGVVTLVFVVFWAIFGGSGSDSARGDASRVDKMRDDLFADLEQYQKIRGPIDAIDKKIEATPADFDLFAALSEIESELGIRDTIRNKTPGPKSEEDFYAESYVDLDLKGLSIQDLVALLEKIEDSPAFLRISQLSIKRSFKEEDRTLDVTMRVSMYSPLEGTK